MGKPGETNVNGTDRNWAYGQTNFEASPLNRVMETYAPWCSLQVLASQGKSDKHSKGQSTFTILAQMMWRWLTLLMSLVLGLLCSYRNICSQWTLQKHYCRWTRQTGHEELENKEGQVILQKVQFSPCRWWYRQRLSRLALHLLRIWWFQSAAACSPAQRVELPTANSWEYHLEQQCHSGTNNASPLMCMTSRLPHEYEKVPGAGWIMDAVLRWNGIASSTQDANLLHSNRWLFTKSIP